MMLNSLLVRSSLYSNVIDYYVQRILRFNLNLNLNLLRAREVYDSLFKADLIVHYFLIKFGVRHTCQI